VEQNSEVSLGNIRNGVGTHKSLEIAIKRKKLICPVTTIKSEGLEKRKAHDNPINLIGRKDFLEQINTMKA